MVKTRSGAQLKASDPANGAFTIFEDNEQSRDDIATNQKKRSASDAEGKASLPPKKAKVVNDVYDKENTVSKANSIPLPSTGDSHASDTTKKIHMSVDEKAMNGAPEGDLYDLVVYEDAELFPFASDAEAMEEVIQSCSKHRDNSTASVWADKYESVVVIRRAALYHAQYVFSDLIESSGGKTKLAMLNNASECAVVDVESLRSCRVRNGILCLRNLLQQNLFSNTPTSSTSSSRSSSSSGAGAATAASAIATGAVLRQVVAVLLAKTGGGPKFISELALQTLRQAALTRAIPHQSYLLYLAPHATHRSADISGNCILIATECFQCMMNCDGDLAVASAANDRDETASAGSRPGAAAAATWQQPLLQILTAGLTAKRPKAKEAAKRAWPVFKSSFSAGGMGGDHVFERMIQSKCTPNEVALIQRILESARSDKGKSNSSSNKNNNNNSSSSSSSRVLNKKESAGGGKSSRAISGGGGSSSHRNGGGVCGNFRAAFRGTRPPLLSKGHTSISSSSSGSGGGGGSGRLQLPPSTTTSTTKGVGGGGMYVLPAVVGATTATTTLSIANPPPPPAAAAVIPVESSLVASSSSSSSSASSTTTTTTCTAEGTEYTASISTCTAAAAETVVGVADDYGGSGGGGGDDDSSTIPTGSASKVEVVEAVAAAAVLSGPDAEEQQEQQPQEEEIDGAAAAVAPVAATKHYESEKEEARGHQEKEEEQEEALGMEVGMEVDVVDVVDAQEEEEEEAAEGCSLLTANMASGSGSSFGPGTVTPFTAVVTTTDDNNNNSSSSEMVVVGLVDDSSINKTGRSEDVLISKPEVDEEGSGAREEQGMVVAEEQVHSLLNVLEDRSTEVVEVLPSHSPLHVHLPAMEATFVDAPVGSSSSGGDGVCVESSSSSSNGGPALLLPVQAPLSLSVPAAVPAAPPQAPEAIPSPSVVAVAAGGDVDEVAEMKTMHHEKEEEGEEDKIAPAPARGGGGAAAACTTDTSASNSRRRRRMSCAVSAGTVASLVRRIESRQTSTASTTGSSVQVAAVVVVEATAATSTSSSSTTQHPH